MQFLVHKRSLSGPMNDSTVQSLCNIPHYNADVDIYDACVVAPKYLIPWKFKKEL